MAVVLLAFAAVVDEAAATDVVGTVFAEAAVAATVDVPDTDEVGGRPDVDAAMPDVPHPTRRTRAARWRTLGGRR